MGLRLSQLRDVAQRAIDERKSTDGFVSEIKRLFGPRVDVGKDAASVAECANYVLDSLERCDVTFDEQCKVSTLLEMRRHNNVEVRRLVTRLLPTRFIVDALDDDEAIVRHTAAKRLPARLVLESLRRHVDDDELNLIYEARKSVQAPHKMVGDAVEQQDIIELSDAYYDSLAGQFIHDYGMSWQQNWSTFIKQFVENTRLMSGVEIDAKRLHDAIERTYETYEDEVIAATTRMRMRESVERLNSRLEPLDESPDVVTTLLVSCDDPTAFIKRVREVYSIKESYLPPAIKKYCVGAEGTVVMIPQRAMIPEGRIIDERDERVLDRFVEAWNTRQRLAGEPIVLGWYVNPMDASVVGFNVSLL